MKMKPIAGTCAALLALNCWGFAFAGGEGWSSDFAESKKEAAESKKDLLIDFTGSDWCGWCIKLNKEVFSQEPFKAGVKDKFVLVELDYPQNKSKLSAETIKQNEELRKAYPVQGFPTILLADAGGKPFAVTGYQAGGPEAYVKHLNELRAKKGARDEAFANAAKASGVEKAKALVAALEAMGLEDPMISKFYGDVTEQIKAADPKDETGFAKKAAAKARLATFQSELQACAQKQDHDSALALVDKTLKEGGFSTEDTQQIMITRAMIFNQQKKFDKALKALDEARAFAPESEMADGMDAARTRIEASKKAAGDGN
jgi:thioredoxin-related protein